MILEMHGSVGVGPQICKAMLVTMDRVATTYLALDAPAAAGLYPRGLSASIRAQLSVADGCEGSAVVGAYAEFGVVNLCGWATTDLAAAAASAKMLRRLAQIKSLRPLLLASDGWTKLVQELASADPGTGLMSLEGSTFRVLVRRTQSFWREPATGTHILLRKIGHCGGFRGHHL